MAELNQHWRLALHALNADVIDKRQLADAFNQWVDEPERDVHDILIEQGNLSTQDIELLFALSKRPDAAEQDLRTSIRLSVQRHLAKGGIGSIDVAMDCDLGRRVALKRIQPQYALDPVAQLRLAREAEITAELEHPAIVPIYNYGVSDDGDPFYCMRLVDGTSLKERTAQLFSHAGNGLSAGLYNSLEFRRLVGSFMIVCRAVEHAHSKQIIHRDIKPTNIIVSEHGEPMLLDWGLAKRLDDSVQLPPDSVDGQLQGCGIDESLHLTIDGVALGTPAFMSPEQACGDETIGPASDIFGLGATLYYLLSNRSLYIGANSQELMAQAKLGQCKPVRNVCSKAPQALAAICDHAIAKNPHDRYTSAGAMADDLERWLSDEPVSVWSDPVSTKARRWFKRHKTFSVGLAVTMAALLISAVLFSAYTNKINQRLVAAIQSEQDARRLAKAHGDLAMDSLRTVTLDIQRKLRYVPAAQDVRARLLDTALESLSKVSTSLVERSEVDLYSVIAHRDLGDLLLEVGNIGDRRGIESAKHEFDLAEKLAEQLIANSPEDIEAQRQLVLCMQRRAGLEQVQGKADEEKAIYLDALARLEKLHKLAPENEEVYRSLGVAHNLIGDLELRNGDVQAGGRHFQAALAIREDQVKRKVKHEDLERDLVVSLNKIGNYYMRIGKSKEAEQYFTRSLTASRTIVDRSPDNYNALRDLSIVNYRLSQLCQSTGRNDESLEFMQTSAELDRRRMALEPSNVTAIRDCVQSLTELATTLRKVGRNADAKQQLETAIELAKKLLTSDPNDKRILRDLAYAYSDLGELQLKEESSSAMLNFEHCLELMKESAARDPSNLRGKSDMAYGLSKRASGHMHLQQFQRAFEDYTAALELQQQRVDAFPDDTNIQASLVELLIGVMEAALEDAAASTSEAYASRLEAAAHKLALQAPEVKQVQVSQLQAWLLLAQHATALGDQSKANEYRSEAFEHYQQLLKRGVVSNEDPSLRADVFNELKKAQPR